MCTFKKIVIGKKYKEIEAPSECIYNLISTSSKFKKQSPRYESIHSSSTKKFYSSGKKCHQTMGYAKIQLNPSEFLKKHTREKKMNTAAIPFSCLDKEHKRPPVPKSNETPPVLPETGVKDFIELNRVNNIRRPALRPAPKLIDNEKGDSFFLEFSGLVPKFSRKKEFGRTPKYLVRRRNDLSYANEVYKKSFEEKQLIKMSEQEKYDLLEGLRDNWEELNKRYITLPLMIDTKTLKTRKLELEKKLDLLEHDIYFLEKSKESDIYILPE